MIVGKKYQRFIDGKQLPFQCGSKEVMVGKYIGIDSMGWLVFELPRKKMCYCLPEESEYREVLP